MTKTALVTGVTGQDGAYLAALLLGKGYKVYGAKRRSSLPNTWRLEELGIADKIEFVGMELMEESNIVSVIETIKPDEFYNLASQSFVQESFAQPLYTSDVGGLAVTRILEAIRTRSPKTRFYQASTSEMFGKVQAKPQIETTPFYPRSPYGVAKLYAHWMTVNYRESYGLFSCSGILFNHESPLRSPEFVTRKITQGLAAVRCGKQAVVELGNLNATRDWGFAGDYVKAMWLMLQQNEPEDYVVATGYPSTVRDFAEQAAQAMGFDIAWQGKEESETGVDRISGKTVIAVNPKYYRPAEVDFLMGDATKAKTKLGWTTDVDIDDLARMMAEADLRRAGGEVMPLRKSTSAAA